VDVDGIQLIDTLKNNNSVLKFTIALWLCFILIKVYLYFVYLLLRECGGRMLCVLHRGKVGCKVGYTMV
jgi:hypothetical protein